MRSLKRPFDVHHVDTPEKYLVAHATACAHRRVRPREVLGAMGVYITGGKWVVRCACGNAPSVDPDWSLACCFECGALYRHLELPPAAAAIAVILSVRPEILRGWLPGESLATLVHENAQVDAVMAARSPR